MNAARSRNARSRRRSSSLIALGLEAVVWADGGLLRARQEAGPFIVSIFTAPEPLRAGPVEVSVLVQSSGGGVLTDAVVDLSSSPPPDPSSGGEPEPRATRRRTSWHRRPSWISRLRASGR